MKIDYNWRRYLDNLLTTHLNIEVPDEDKEKIKKWFEDLLMRLP